MLLVHLIIKVVAKEGTMAASRVSVLLLGPLEVQVLGTPIVITGARRRALLARLIIHPKELVPEERLMEDLLGGRPSRAPANALKAYISHLRAVLESDRAGRAPDPSSSPAGPAMSSASSPATSTACRLPAWFGRPRPLAAGRAAEVTAILSEALALWRGPARTQFADQSRVVVELRGEEQRWAAREDRMKAELALGGNGAMGEAATSPDWAASLTRRNPPLLSPCSPRLRPGCSSQRR